MKNQTVSVRPATDGQLDDIRATMMQHFPKGLSFDDAQSIIGNKGEFGSGISRAFEPFVRTKSVLYWIDEWTRFYSEVFGLECDYSHLRVPVSQEGFGWLIVADDRITTQAAFEKCQERFPSWKYADDSLDKAVPADKGARSHKNGTYAIWVRDVIEADEDLKNRSAVDLARDGVPGITLRERLVLELWHHWKTGKHLDIENYTLCAGSRSAGGGVPGVRWAPGSRKLRVGWCYSSDRYDSVRCRRVVS